MDKDIQISVSGFKNLKPPVLAGRGALVILEDKILQVGFYRWNDGFKTYEYELYEPSDVNETKMIKALEHQLVRADAE